MAIYMYDFQYNQCVYPANDSLGYVRLDGQDEGFHPWIKSQISLSMCKKNSITNL